MKKNEGRVRAFAVKVVRKRLSVSPFSGLLKGCKGHKTHRFENGGTNQIPKTGKREVVFHQPLPQTLYARMDVQNRCAARPVGRVYDI